MRFSFIPFLLFFLSGFLSGGEEHEYSDIRWVNLDTVKLKTEPLGTLPSLNAVDIKGRSVNLLNIYPQDEGVFILSYMAEWCKNCHYDAPLIEKLYKNFSELGLKMAIIMEYSTLQGAMAFINKYGLSMPVYFGQLQVKDKTKRHLTEHYALRNALSDDRGWGTPFHLIIENGNLNKVGVVTGELKPGKIRRYLAHTLLTKENFR